jgi:hypothetical protein
MARKHPGNTAPYSLAGECTWCTGVGAGTLSSSSFGSCVGLALFSPQHRIGVVAHYPGGLGLPKKRTVVHTDTMEILRAVCPVRPGIWKAWVFGGISLSSKSKSDLSTTTVPMTKALIDAVRHELKMNPYIPVNVLRNNPQYQEPEMTNGYVGHSEVRLDLQAGTVAWS